MAISTLWTRENLAWAAGLFEGEGSISVKDQTSQMSLTMSDEDVVRKFRDIVGMGNVYGPLIDNRKPTYKPLWRWSAGGAKQSQALLAALWPWLGKRRQSRAEEAIVACSRREPYGDAKVRCVNGHGFTPENTYRWNGIRGCRQCRKSAGELGNVKRSVRRGNVDIHL